MGQCVLESLSLGGGVIKEILQVGSRATGTAIVPGYTYVSSRV